MMKTWMIFPALFIPAVFAEREFESQSEQVPVHLYEIVNLGQFDEYRLRVVVFSKAKKSSYPYLQWLEREGESGNLTVTTTVPLKTFNFKAESTNYRTTREDDTITIILEFSRRGSRAKIKLVIRGKDDVVQTRLK